MVIIILAVKIWYFFLQEHIMIMNIPTKENYDDQQPDDNSNSEGDTFSEANDDCVNTYIVIGV